MTERPILFSSPMIPPIFADTKLRTRRIVKAREDIMRALAAIDRPRDWTWKAGADGHGGLRHADALGVTSIPLRCPYGVPGDRLWVREAFAYVDQLAEDIDREDPMCVGYKVDHVALRHYGGNERSLALDTAHWNWKHSSVRWRPGIHMPRWASRITLEVESVRVERLHEITEEEARLEGVEPKVTTRKVYPSRHAADIEHRSYRDGFADLWGAINGAESWKANPFVWVVAFKRIEQLRLSAKAVAGG